MDVDCLAIDDGSASYDLPADGAYLAGRQRAV
jgi:hypothetical protein